ncbi:pirin family protein [Microbacterium sp. ARD31]|uniref:pirin family protein n=1 Tax=Microbacterium sp. ARD31 TaxID=2962576 RepID=UPI002882B741|nr:pirin family protein [Microbacterium sp. ARD31]MDT0183648.1 pirin family protein [Microbacterium sp. ARD31]
MTDVEVLTPREVPLGGPRAMRVRRTLPQRHRSLIGAWCFVDHYGPDEVDETGGMVLPAHPHTGLQTASWLFDGELEHRDSVGSLATVRPGELNLMTAGRGISHTEVSTPGTSVLHGAQLWIALPDESRHVEPRFEHFVPEPVRGPGWEARVFIGSLLGASSPVVTHTPLLGAELMLAPGRTLEVDVDETFEHGVLLDVGAIDVDGQELAPSDLCHVPDGRSTITVTAHEEARLLLLGGPPFGEPIVMWWNFIGRSHDEIAGYRQEWQEQIAAGGGDVVADGREVAVGRFGVVDLELQPIPAPALPNVRLKLRH